MYNSAEETEKGDNYRFEASAALRAVREEICWRTSKDLQHLKKRKEMGHLPKDFSMEDYNSLIEKLIGKDDNFVYLYVFGSKRYYAVRGEFLTAQWLVIFDKQGIIETAFPPYDIKSYLKNRGFVLIGRIGEILK